MGPLWGWESRKRSHSARSPCSHLRAEELTESFPQAVPTYPFMCRKKCLTGPGRAGLFKEKGVTLLRAREGSEGRNWTILKDPSHPNPSLTPEPAAGGNRVIPLPSQHLPLGLLGWRQVCDTQTCHHFCSSSHVRSQKAQK